MNNLKLQKKHFIKIPKSIDVIYCKKRSILLFKGPLKTKSLTVKKQNCVYSFKKFYRNQSFSYKK